jgi:hypothetical protein
VQGFRFRANIGGVWKTLGVFGGLTGSSSVMMRKTSSRILQHSVLVALLTGWLQGVAWLRDRLSMAFLVATDEGVSHCDDMMSRQLYAGEIKVWFVSRSSIFFLVCAQIFFMCDLCWCVFSARKRSPESAIETNVPKSTLASSKYK